jgi:hypothetical protein
MYIAFFKINGKNTSATITAKNPRDAYKQCRNLIKQQLKSQTIPVITISEIIDTNYIEL